MPSCPFHVQCQQPVRTSLSHPLRIDEIHAGDRGGRIGICLCPGKQAGSLSGPRWERDLAADLEVVRRWPAAVVVSLIEAHEFVELGVTGLGPLVRALGIDWLHLPIVDFHRPDARFEFGWRSLGPVLSTHLRAGSSVLLHCRGGLGRSGTVAARLLMELELPASQAIARVRAARPGAIETTEQVDYLLNLPLTCPV